MEGEKLDISTCEAMVLEKPVENNAITKSNDEAAEEWNIEGQGTIVQAENNCENGMSESETVLLGENDDKKNNDKEFEKFSICNSVGLKAFASVNNITEIKLQKPGPSSSDNDLPYEKSFQGTLAFNASLSLPTSPTLYSSMPSYGNEKHKIDNEVKELKDSKVLYSDEEETVFNNNSFVAYPSNEVQSIHIQEKDTVVKECCNDKSKDNEDQAVNTNLMQCNELIDEKDNERSTESMSKSENSKDVIEQVEQIGNHNVEKLSTIPPRNSRTYNSTTRPTLADDSKMVKISLPTNPINIMQSNTQFLNKSRNFLNFITEKSTNIMEKALLPQHLAVRYNSVLKLTDTGCNEKKYVDESCTSTETPSTNLASNSESDLLSKTKNDNSFPVPVLPLKVHVNNDRSERLVHENQNAPPQSIKESKIDIDVRQKEKDLLSTSTLPNLLSSIDKNSYLTQNDVHDGLNIINATDSKTKEYLEINGNSNVCFNCTLKYTNNLNLLDKDQVDNSQQESLLDNDLKSSKHGLLQHPAYLTLLKDYASLKSNNLMLLERIDNLEQTNRTLEAERKGEIFTEQIETLEKTVDRLTNELRLAVATQETLKKEYAAANKERESMVMKYAVSEKQLIDTQRARDSAENKVKLITKEQELLQNKLRQVQGERTRICNILDGKCREVGDLQKEVEKLREEVQMRDVKLKWTQNKLKTEMDLQKETQQKLDKALARMYDMKEECEQVRRESQESIRKFQQSEENKAVTLDQQLKEQQARLILERHVIEDKEMLRLQLQKEVEVLKNRQQVLIEENNTLSLKIQESEKSRLNCESNLSNLKVVADQRQKEIVDLLGKVSQLETLKLQLQHKEQCLTSINTEMEHLRSANEELQSDMRACRQREADMLDFTQKLTDKNVRLQSEFSAIEAKVKQLESEQGPLRERIHELTNKVKTLENNVAQEQQTRLEECEILARHVAQQTQLAQNFAQKLEDSQGENAVLRRKQQISTKEMARELQQCRKKLEAYEVASPTNSLDITSRTGSNTSLNTGDVLNGALSDNNANGDHIIHTLEPDRQTLIDRIIKLQNINVKRAEKLDFLEEHNRTLVEELQKKTKIIQNYILHESFGAMGSNERDRHKAELARYGGIMASIYSQRVSDDNMTLERSLEINQKQQTVLEDALLKNITLKDNIDTLGKEIEKLIMQNQQKQVTS